MYIILITLEFNIIKDSVKGIKDVDEREKDYRKKEREFLDNIFSLSKQFFDLPLDEKMKIHMKNN